MSMINKTDAREWLSLLCLHRIAEPNAHGQIRLQEAQLLVEEKRMGLFGN
jgi:hypothetical protein